MQQQLPARKRFVSFGLIIGTILLLTTTSFAQADTDNPPGRVARISYLKGNVSLLPAGQTEWSAATLNYVVTTGDHLYTDRDARAELEVGAYTVRLWEQTDLTVTNLDDDIMQLGLNQGSLRASVYQIPSGNTVEIDTPNGSLTVLEEGRYRADVDPNAGRTLVTVNRGKLGITGGDMTETLDHGKAALLAGRETIQVEFVDMPAQDDFDKWSEERDRRLAAAASAAYVSPFIPGYDDLDAYGRWVDVAEYGPVWYPVVPVGWVPYHFGYWSWIDPWGWTWIGEEVWSFCTFHYGRWVLIGGVWGWLPGPIGVVPIYAPAFVAFLGGQGFSIGIGVGTVGWFPLGPADPFFPWYHYSGHYLQQVNATNIRNVNVTNITNITDITKVHYAYKDVATTAVPASVLANGQPVAKHLVHLSPEQLAKAQVVPHPPVNPTPRAVAPGKPTPPPAVHGTHLPVASRIAQVKPPPSSAMTRGAASPELSKIPSRPPATVHPPRAVPEPRTGMPPLITRRPPPPPVMPFKTRLPVMVEHPGRPLEPVQLQNLRAGRPAGPMLDKEFPSHPMPMAREPIRPLKPKP